MLLGAPFQSSQVLPFRPDGLFIPLAPPLPSGVKHPVYVQEFSGLGCACQRAEILVDQVIENICRRGFLAKAHRTQIRSLILFFGDGGGDIG